eukprot:10939882-Alexandrium_andersonii.AAC.2
MDSGPHLCCQAHEVLVAEAPNPARWQSAGMSVRGERVVVVQRELSCRSHLLDVGLGEAHDWLGAQLVDGRESIQAVRPCEGVRVICSSGAATE